MTTKRMHGYASTLGGCDKAVLADILEIERLAAVPMDNWDAPDKRKDMIELVINMGTSTVAGLKGVPPPWAFILRL